MDFVDRILTCTDCGGEFIFTAGEQLFFLDKQFKNDPKRCKPCKSRRGAQARARHRVAVRQRLASRAPRHVPSVRNAVSRRPSRSSRHKAAPCSAASATRTSPFPAPSRRRPHRLPRSRPHRLQQPADLLGQQPASAESKRLTSVAAQPPQAAGIRRRGCFHGDLISRTSQLALRVALKAESPEPRGLR